MSVLAEVNRLRRLTWNALSREAVHAGLTNKRIREAATLDELRLAILKAKYPEVATDDVGTRG
jgi:hypothetical protein